MAPPLRGCIGLPVPRQTASGIRYHGPVQIKGIAAHFGIRNSNGDLFAPGAFHASLNSIKKGAKNVVFLSSHSWEKSDQVLGSILSLSADEKNLRFTAQFAETATARDIATLVRGGHLSGVSIGFWPKESVDVDLGRRSLPGRDIARADLMEISLVVFPADAQARVTAVV